jgi:hypothetical protein
MHKPIPTADLERAARAFFYDHAGASWNPETETEEQGRLRGARELAAAERTASALGWSFEWSIDPDIDSSEWLDDNEDGGRNRDPWHTWKCAMYADGEFVTSLHGIDFGRDGHPNSDPYRRIIEAELALEHVGDLATATA